MANSIIYQVNLGPNMGGVLFSNLAAAQEYQKHVQECLPSAGLAGLIPSTSPIVIHARVVIDECPLQGVALAS